VSSYFSLVAFFSSLLTLTLALLRNLRSGSAYFFIAQPSYSNRYLLQDCAVAVSRMFVPPAHSKSKSKAKDKKDKGKTKDTSAPAADGGSEQPEPIDVFVDFLVGCLERGTAYSRTIATKAFEPLCGALTESSVKFIMDVSAQCPHYVDPALMRWLQQLERRPVTVAQPEEDEDVEMGGGEINGAAHSHSEESADGSDSESDEDEDEDEDSENGSGGDEDEDEEDEDNAGDAELRARLEEALRLSGIQPAGEDDEEEELMDDDQMMQFDEQLVAVFRTRKAEKGGAKQSALSALRTAVKDSDLQSRRPQRATTGYSLQEPCLGSRRYLSAETSDQSTPSQRRLTTPRPGYWNQPGREATAREDHWHYSRPTRQEQRVTTPERQL